MNPVDGCWPYTAEADDFHRQQQEVNRRLHDDLQDAWRVILDHLPAEQSKQLQDAIRLIEWRL